MAVKINIIRIYWHDDTKEEVCLYAPTNEHPDMPQVCHTERTPLNARAVKKLVPILVIGMEDQHSVLSFLG